MSMRLLLVAVVTTLLDSTLGAEMPFSGAFALAVVETGPPYREMVARITNDIHATTHLTAILRDEPDEWGGARCARILLARIEHPDVFADFDSEMLKWRQTDSARTGYGGRPGYLSGTLLLFARQGIESASVDVPTGWETVPANTNGGASVLMRQMRYQRVTKFSDETVRKGIARNAAARQAILEHFLKFLGDGGAYEQSEMVLLVNRLWGRGRVRRTVDLAIVDHVNDAEALTDAVFQNEARPAAARVQAAFCLDNSGRSDVRAFMLSIVTNTPSDDAVIRTEAIVNRALSYLEMLASPSELGILKSYTNCPAWKREKIMDTVRAVEQRIPAR